MAPVKFKEGSYGFFAEMDYEDLQIYSKVTPIRCRALCLSCQQCIEKYLKQVVREKGAKPGDPVLEGHNLIRVALKSGYPNVEKYRQELLSLGKLYFDGRYPNEADGYMFIEPTPAETRHAMEVVEDVRNWVLEELNIAIKNTHSTLKRMDLSKGK